MTEYKIVMSGSVGVGKSALIVQLINSHFVDEWDPTIEGSCLKQATIDDEVCLLDILDPPSQDDYSAMYELYMRTGQGFVLVYAINSPSSFEKLHEFRSRILQVKGRDNVPLVLVGNKYDLTNERKVTTEEGMDLAKTWNCPFFETSAKTGINVEECFFQLVREIRKDNLSKHSGNKKRESKLRDCKFM